MSEMRGYLRPSVSLPRFLVSKRISAGVLGRSSRAYLRDWLSVVRVMVADAFGLNRSDQRSMSAAWSKGE